MTATAYLDGVLAQSTTASGTYEVDENTVILNADDGDALKAEYRNGKLYALDESGAVVKNGDYDLAFEKK